MKMMLSMLKMQLLRMRYLAGEVSEIHDISPGVVFGILKPWLKLKRICVPFADTRAEGCVCKIV